MYVLIAYLDTLPLTAPSGPPRVISSLPQGPWTWEEPVEAAQNGGMWFEWGGTTQRRCRV